MIGARDINPLVLALWAALLLAVLVALFLARWSLAFVSLATLLLSIAPAVLASRLSLRLPVSFLLAITLFVFGSIFLGEAFDFYERLWWWDLLLHGFSAMGFGLVGFLFVFMLFEGDRFAAPPVALALITFCVAITIGVVWEIFEYAMDVTFGMNMQKSGLDDTMGDLIIDAVGGAIAGLTGFIYLKRERAGVLGWALAEFIALNRRLYQKSRRRLRGHKHGQHRPGDHPPE